MPTEIIAMFDGTPIDVAHLVRQRRTRNLWLAAAACGAVAAVGAVAIGSAVAAEAREHAAWTKPAYAYRPRDVPGLAELATVAGALGVAIAVGLARSRRVRSTYWIGEGGDLPVGAAQRFPLVEDARVNVPDAWACLHVVAGDAREVRGHAIAVPADGMLVMTAGPVELHVSRVRAAPRIGRARPDRQLAPLAAGAGAVLFVIAPWIALTPPGAAVRVDVASREPTTVHAAIAANEDMPPRAPIGHRHGDDRDDDRAGAGGPMRGDDGATGLATVPLADGHVRIAATARAPAISREQAIVTARVEGVLGSATLEPAIHALAGTTDFTSGFDTTTAIAPLFGATGDDRGLGGFGLARGGDGGGCTGGCGTIGTGPARLFGSGHERGTGWGEHGTGGAETVGRGRLGEPTVQIGPVTADGIAPEVVRRYLRRMRDRFAYCHDKQQLADPALADGAIELAATMRGDGRLVDPRATGYDDTVSACTIDVVRDLELPHPADGVATFTASIVFRRRGP